VTNIAFFKSLSKINRAFNILDTIRFTVPRLGKGYFKNGRCSNPYPYSNWPPSKEISYCTKPKKDIQDKWKWRTRRFLIVGTFRGSVTARKLWERYILSVLVEQPMRRYFLPWQRLEKEEQHPRGEDQQYQQK
jgi:hypothetical protein